MNNYKLLGRAGEGAHGFVFKGLDLRSNKIVALKKITVNLEAGLPKNTLREICALRALKSIYIVELLEVSALGNSVVLVMEYLPCSLGDIIQSNLILTLPQIKTYLNMILSGIEYMHDNNIMHRDIKPFNLLISEEGILKIGDFGLARIYTNDTGRQYSHQVATRWYRAPELLYGSRTYNPSVDMWSVGCIFGEMINKKPIFPGESDIEQLAIVLSTLGTPNEETWPGLTDLPDYNKIEFSPSMPKSWKSIIPSADSLSLDLIQNLLLYDGNRRFTAREALDHSIFKEEPLPASLSEMPNIENFRHDSKLEFDNFDEILLK